MGVPFEIAPIANEPFTGGVARVLRIKMPSRAFISKIVVKQTDGALVAFTVDLFNNRAVFDAIPVSDSENTINPAVGRIPEDCFRVCPTLNGVGGSLVHFSEDATGGHGYSFVCTDVDPRNFKSQGFIYARITPAGSGAQRFAIAIGGDAQVGGA